LLRGELSTFDLRGRSAKPKILARTAPELPISL